MTRISWLAALILVLLLTALPAAQPAPAVVVRAARWLDVAAGQIRTPAVVVVQGGRIASVGGTAPAGAETIDLGDVTLLPGLIDAHTHLTYDIEGDWVTRPVRELPADAALRGARNARRTLEAGFTTVRDVGAPGFADVSLMKAIDAAWSPARASWRPAYALSITGGHCDETGWAPGILERGPEEGIVDGVDAALRAVRYQLKHGAKVIKICATAGVLSFEATVGAQQLSDEEMKAVVDEAARHGIKVAAHGHGSEGILAAVKAGVQLDRSRLDADRRDHRADEEARHIPGADRLPPRRAAPRCPAAAPRGQGSPDHSARPGKPSAGGQGRREGRVRDGCGRVPAWRQRPRVRRLRRLRDDAARGDPRGDDGAADLLGVGDRGVIAAGQARGSRRRARRSAQGHQGHGAGVVRDEGRHRRATVIRQVGVRWSAGPQACRAVPAPSDAVRRLRTEGGYGSITRSFGKYVW